MVSRRDFIAKSGLGLSTILLGDSIISLASDKRSTFHPLANVNTTDIENAIRLGCKTMGNVFNPEDNNVPYFHSEVFPNAKLAFNASFSEAHVPGRHLNALLAARDIFGSAVTAGSVIEKHANALFFSYSGSLPLPLNRTKIGEPLNRFLPHNLREGFHGLYAMCRFQQSAEAVEVAKKSIDFIFQHWIPTKGWNSEIFTANNIEVEEWPGPFITGIARCIGPLVKLYKATGYEPALALAIRLKDESLNHYFLEDGSYDTEKHGFHTHSLTCTLSSLAQLADLTNDSGLKKRVRAFFDHGLPEISDDLGWCIENSGEKANPDRGECNNTGDILETALLLGKWGYTSYYHTAERILRGHLLPSQLRDVSFIIQPPNPEGIDGLNQVAQRHLGAFGFPAPYGHHPVGANNISFNMDIVGGAVASLCEAYNAIHTRGAAGHFVNMLFDYQTSALAVQSPYTNEHLQITVNENAPLFVRVPGWLNLQQIELTGAVSLPTLQNGYLCIPNPPKGQKITLKFPLVIQEEELKHRSHNIRYRLRGDEVTHMDNFGADLTYFKAY